MSRTQKVTRALPKFLGGHSVLASNTQFTIYSPFSEPLELPLDLEYKMNVVKEISVTDPFLSLDKNIRGCQEESYNECTTRIHMNALISKCNCLPFQLRLNEEVSSRVE